MPQTRNGASDNPWITYMKACAVHYRLGHTHPPVEAETSENPVIKKRITKKQPDPNAIDVEIKPTTGKKKAKPKAAPKPITGQDMKKTIKKSKTVSKK